jgi:hypothetical protein
MGSLDHSGPCEDKPPLPSSCHRGSNKAIDKTGVADLEKNHGPTGSLCRRECQHLYMNGGWKGSPHLCSLLPLTCKVARRYAAPFSPPTQLTCEQDTVVPTPFTLQAHSRTSLTPASPTPASPVAPSLSLLRSMSPLHTDTPTHTSGSSTPRHVAPLASCPTPHHKPRQKSVEPLQLSQARDIHIHVPIPITSQSLPPSLLSFNNIPLSAHIRLQTPSLF